MSTKPKKINSLFLLYNSLLLVFTTLMTSYAVAAPKGNNKPVSLPELIIPVDKETARELINNMHIKDKESLFFTKRYRIVKINMALLDGKTSRFKITPFKGRSTTVEMTEFITKYPGRYKWMGEVYYGAPIDKIPGLTKEDKKALRHSSKVNISIGPVFNNFKGINSTGNSSNLPSRILEDESPGGPFQAINLQYVSHINKRKIKIRSLMSDLNYHILVEDDGSKTLSADGNDAESNNRRANFRVHQEILKSNPKMMVNPEKWEQ